VPLDQPRGVVTDDEAADGLAQLIDGVVQLNPEALLLQGADPLSTMRSDPPQKAAILLGPPGWSSW